MKALISRAGLAVACSAGFIVMTATLAIADTGLYDAPPPENAVFLRFIHQSNATVVYNGVSFPVEEAAGNYLVTTEDIAGYSPWSFVSILPDGTEIVEPQRSAEKVTIGLINLSQAPVSLKTADGNVEIISLVEQGSAGWRDVNPIAVSVGVFEQGIVVGEAIDLLLRRNANPTIVVGPDSEIDILESRVLSGVIE